MVQHHSQARSPARTPVVEDPKVLCVPLCSGMEGLRGAWHPPSLRRLGGGGGQRDKESGAAAPAPASHRAEAAHPRVTGPTVSLGSSQPSSGVQTSIVLAASLKGRLVFPQDSIPQCAREERGWQGVGSRSHEPAGGPVGSRSLVPCYGRGDARPRASHRVQLEDGSSPSGSVHKVLLPGPHPVLE